MKSVYHKNYIYDFRNNAMSQSKTNPSISRAKFIYSQKCTHHALLLLYLFRDEKELPSGFPPSYQLQEKGVQILNHTVI